ncbi:MAG: Rdx family protein [Bacillales bacterium]
MAEELLKFKENLSEIVLIPSSGGVFEVKVGEQLIFSKKKLARFPEEGEISNIIKEKRLLTEAGRNGNIS